MNSTPTDDLSLETLVASTQTALTAKAKEQDTYDDLSIRLEALLSEFTAARRTGDSARLELRTALQKYAPGHNDLAFPGLLSDQALARSRQLEDALRARGLDVAAALRPAVATRLLETWKDGGSVPPATG